MADTDLTMEEIADLQASDELAKVAQDTPPGGEYIAQVFSCKMKRVDAKSQYNPGRIYYLLGAVLYYADEYGNMDEQAGKVWMRCSHEPRYRDNGDADLQTQLYLDLCKELSVDMLRPKDLFTLLSAGDCVFGVWGKDSYQEGFGSERIYLEPDEHEKRASLIKAGYKGAFNVFSIKSLMPKETAPPTASHWGGPMTGEDDIPF